MSKIKLIIQIPCLNEAETLPSVIAELPRKIEGVDEIYTLVIDDGSTDNTTEVARRLGVDYIVRNATNLGLVKSFSRGLEVSLSLGADIIANTDGDNQYRGSDIAKLIKPILEKRADVVIGCRDIDACKEFAKLKKLLQKFGSAVVSRLSRSNIPDVTSGFRAISRAAGPKFFFMGNFSYTLEMLIQASRLGLKVDWVPIEVNPRLRESRLFKSNFDFIVNQLKVLLKVYLFYYPLRFFSYLAAISFVLSLGFACRILYYLTAADPEMIKFKAGTGILFLFTSLVGVLFLATGLLGSVLSGLRFLLIDMRSRTRDIELQQNNTQFDFDIITAPQFFRWKEAEIQNEIESDTKQ